MSYDDTIGGQGSLGPEGNDATSETIAIKDGQFLPGGSAFSPQSNKTTSTRGRERSGNFGGMPPARPKQSLRNVSNIHQLYQDLFITDMKDEIAVASNEVIQLRQELLLKDQQNAQLRKQNLDLKSKVQCYRKIVAENVSRDEVPASMFSTAQAAPLDPQIKSFRLRDEPLRGAAVPEDDILRESQQKEGAAGENEAFARTSQEDQLRISRGFSAGSGPGEVGVSTQKTMLEMRAASPTQDEHSRQSRTEFASPVALRSFKSLGKQHSRHLTETQKQMLAMMPDMSPSEAFVANSMVLKDIFSATTLRELFAGASSSLKKVFKVHKVNFLLVCKETQAIYKKEEGQSMEIHHAHTLFNLVVPDGHNLARKKYDFNPGFNNMNDVNKGKICTGRYCVWPVHNLRRTSQITLYVQLEYKANSPLSFERNRDRKAMEIVATIIANIIERVSVFSKIEAAQMRAFNVLDTCKYFE